MEEARVRADEDYKLARINGLDIPEMPQDYDDFGLRELIENESALRSTGDAALNIKMEQLNELESEERKRADINLQNQIDALQDQYIYYGDNPPAEPHIGGQLWFSTAEEELTLYIYDETNWVPASPRSAWMASKSRSMVPMLQPAKRCRRSTTCRCRLIKNRIRQMGSKRQDEKLAELEARPMISANIERGVAHNPDLNL